MWNIKWVPEVVSMTRLKYKTIKYNDIWQI